jgi:hypothetical protein
MGSSFKKGGKIADWDFDKGFGTYARARSFFSPARRLQGRKTTIALRLLG